MVTCIAKNTVSILQRNVKGRLKYRLDDTGVEFIIENAYIPLWRYRISKNVLLTDFNDGKPSNVLAFEIYKCYKSYITKLFFK